MTLTLTIDRMTSSCRVSSKSTSLELLLHLHTIVGAAALQRTNEGSSTARGSGAAQQPAGFGGAHTSQQPPNQGGERRRGLPGDRLRPSAS